MFSSLEKTRRSSSLYHSLQMILPTSQIQYAQPTENFQDTHVQLICNLLSSNMAPQLKCKEL